MMKFLIFTNFILITLNFVNSTPVSAVHGKNSLQRAITFTEPTQPLQFRDNVKKKPKKKNLKKSRLLRKMGTDYKGQWMSIDEPANVDDTTMEMSEDQNAQLVEQLNSLNLSQELEELSGSQSNAINSQAVAIFQQWLVKKSSCPVNFKWIDLGEYFWPRWIRQGACEKNNQNQTNTNNESLFETTQTAESFEETIAGENSSSIGCSWPQGMNCVQGEVQMLQILRWHCRTRHDRAKNAKRRKCKWYKVPYPVTASCKCACSNI